MITKLSYNEGGGLEALESFAAGPWWSPLGGSEGKITGLFR